MSTGITPGRFGKTDIAAREASRCEQLYREAAALREQVNDIYDRILTTPARSPAGLLGQFDFLCDITGQHEFINTIISGVKRLAGGVGFGEPKEE